MPPLRVLVVDDEPTILAMFADVLRHAGFDVEATPTMADALDLLTDRRFDAIVADLQLPDIRPFDTIAALRASAPDSRIVVCSAFLTEELRRNAREFGATAVLEKPLASEQLVAAVSGKT